MNAVEAEGQTIEEAVAVALSLLGATSDQVEIEVLAQPSRGFMGIGGKRARVRATRRAAIAVATGEEEEAGRPVAAAREPAAPPSEVGRRAREVLREVLSLMGVEAAVEVEQTPEEVLLRVEIPEGGFLIGRKGQTLDALEYLVNRMVTRGEEGEARVVLDVERYRERRKKSLEELALRLGERAKRRRKSVTLNPLSPKDRRTVHLALRDDRLLVTKSVGEGYHRRLIIVPAGAQKGAEPTGAGTEERPRRGDRRERPRRARG